jgi:hypothetical protein
MGDQKILTMDAVRAAYPPDRYILVTPAVSKISEGAGGMYGLDVATVKIDPANKDHVYELETKNVQTVDGWRTQVTKLGLSKVAIDLIAGAADANAFPERVDPGTNPLYAQYRAFAIMQTPGGAVRGRSASVEWDGELMRERILAQVTAGTARARRDGWSGKSPIGVRWKDLTDEQAQRVIETNFQQRWLDEREFGKRKAESKAARNALKALLAISDSYPPEVLETKEFAVVKWVFAPDTSDPEVKRLVVTAGLQAQRALFGVNLAASAGGSFLPDGSEHAVAALPPAADPNPAPESADAVVEVEDATEPEPAVASANVSAEVLAAERTWDEAQPLLARLSRQIDAVRTGGAATEILDQLTIQMEDAVVERNADRIFELLERTKAAK